MADKIDFKKTLKELYNPPAKGFMMVDVPRMNFLMVDGHGNPNESLDYQQALEALYALAYAIKFALKPQAVDYVVPPLEGLWWADDMDSFSRQAKDRWDWTMMIMQPDMVTPALVEQVQREVERKKNLPALEKMRFDAYHEGLSAQVLYTGAYADEGPTIARLHDFIAEQGYMRRGKHHEIYLGDPRKTSPEKLKTIIRQPARKQADRG